MSMSKHERAAKAAVDAELATNEWPIWQTSGDLRLERYEYLEFFNRVLLKYKELLNG